MEDLRVSTYEPPVLQEIGGFAEETLGQGIQFPEGDVFWFTH